MSRWFALRASSLAAATAALYVFAIREQHAVFPHHRAGAIPARSESPVAPRTAPRFVLDERVRGRAAAAAALALVAVFAVISRLRYIVSFDGVFGSGDAHTVLVHALLIRSWSLHPEPQLVISGDTFGQPALIPALLAASSRVTTLSLAHTTLIVTPLLTIVALLVLTYILGRQLGWEMAAAAGVLIAILPKLSFDATEPEKSPYVVSCVIFALAAVYASRQRPRMVIAAGAFTALAMLAHTTGYLFLPVIALSYVMLAGRPLRRLLTRDVIIALALPLLAVVVYVALARIFDQPPPSSAATAPAGGGSLFPPFLQQYIDGFVNLLHGGVADRAWKAYFVGVRAQLGTPVVVLAYVGFARGLYALLIERDRRIAPFVLWMALITLGFSMQYTSSSHGSRYPSYVTPAYMVLAVYAVASLCRVPRMAYAGLVALTVLVSFAGWTYASAANPGLRDLYASHMKAARYIDQQRLLDDGGLVYLGWPSVTFNILEDRPDYANRLYEFGFGQRPLEEFTPEFIAEQHIKYFLYDHTGNDYFHSADVVRNQLGERMMLREIGTFAGRPGSYVTLYAISPRSTWTPTAVQQWFGARNATNLLSNGGLCTTAGKTMAWQPNGWVNLAPAGGDDAACGVLVRNANEYGGVRQQVPNSVPGKPVSFLVAVRAVPPSPAKTALIALYGGTTQTMLAQREVALSPQTTYTAIETFAPTDASPLRAVIASGAGDSGDLVVEAAALEPGRISDVLADGGGG